MSGLFKYLEDNSSFKKFVGQHYSRTPCIISDWFDCENELGEQRIHYAHGEYCQNLEKFSALLSSSNPDHYKRAGSLLHALYQSNIVTAYTLKNGKFGSVDDLESGFTMVSHGDAQHVLRFVEFYEEYHNQMLAFELSYRSCASYEDSPTVFDFDYLHNVCRYLKANNNLSLDSCFMLFKSLMLKG